MNSCVGTDAGDGQLGSLPPSWTASKQFFGRWNAFEDFATVALAQVTPPGIRPVDFIYAHAAGPTWWSVDIYAREVTRVVLPGDPAVGPLSRDQILAQGLDCSKFKAFVSYNNMSFARNCQLDVGSGIRLDVNSAFARMQLGIPQGPNNRFIEVNNLNRKDLDPLDEGVILDTIISAEIKPEFSPRGQYRGTLTQRVVQTTAVNPFGAVIAVPCGAKVLSIYADATALASDWFWFNADPNVFSGATPFGIVIAARNGADHEAMIYRVPVPQNACFIAAADDGAERFFTLEWELEY